MEQPKWYKSDRDVKVGDVVLFMKKEKEYAGYYQYGMIKKIEVGKGWGSQISHCWVSES